MGNEPTSKKKKHKRKTKVHNILKPSSYDILYDLDSFNDSTKKEIFKDENCIKYECKNNNNEVIFIYKINYKNLTIDNKNSLISQIKFMNSLNDNKNCLKIIESYIINDIYLYVVTEYYENINNISKYNNKLNVEDIKNIITQINNALLNIYLNKKLKELTNIDLGNIIETKNNIFKFYSFPIFENMGKEIIPPEKLLNKENFNKIHIWNLGLLLYRLYEGKDFNYQNDLDNLNERIKEDIYEKYINNCENKEENLLQNLIKDCLVIDDEKRINLENYFYHPFFNHIYIGKIEDKNKNKKNDYLKINVINFPKINFKKLNLFCYEDTDKIYSNLDNFNNELKI
jgi:serine/threonine protein kinase